MSTLVGFTFREDAFHYVIYSILMMGQRPSPVTLIPLLIFAVFKVLEYLNQIAKRVAEQRTKKFQVFVGRLIHARLDGAR